MKHAVQYLNLLSEGIKDRWEPMKGLEEKVWIYTITEDRKTGHYTRLTKFAPGCDTSGLGHADHDYQEEVLVLQGDLYDAAFDMTLTAGDYCCRPLHEVHGPFRTRTGCLVFEVAYPAKRKAK